MAGRGEQPEERGGAKRARKIGIILMALLVLGFVAVALKANAWKYELPISGVRVEGNAIVGTPEILRLAAIPKGEKLFTVDLGAVRERIKKNPYLRLVSVNRQGPEGISIGVVERQPVAILVADPLLYLDEEGTVLPPARSENLFDLPVITGAFPASDCVPGKRVTTEGLHDAIRLLVSSREIGDELFRRISEVQVLEGGELMLHTAEGGVPVLVGRDQFGAKLVKFDGFWREIVDRRGPQRLQQVDLRFEDQVVVRWNGNAAPR